MKNRWKPWSVFFLMVVMTFLLTSCGTGEIRNKWYMVNDDDFWMEIDGSTIDFYSVHTDEKVAEANVNISDDKIVVSNLNKIDSGAFTLHEDTYTYIINGEELALTNSSGNKEVFSTDIKYKHDH